LCDFFFITPQSYPKFKLPYFFHHGGIVNWVTGGNFYGLSWCAGYFFTLGWRQAKQGFAQLFLALSFSPPVSVPLFAALFFVKPKVPAKRNFNYWRRRICRKRVKR
jgi:hypothetical protein